MAVGAPANIRGAMRLPHYRPRTGVAEASVLRIETKSRFEFFRRSDVDKGNDGIIDDVIEPAVGHGRAPRITRRHW